jgi:deoxyribonuclease V
LTDRNLRIVSQSFSKRFPAQVDISSVDLNALRKEQILIAKKIILKDTFKTPEILAGVDLSYKESNCIVAYVALKSKTLEVLEKRAITHKVVFPYIPTFLAYREGPPILALIEQLDKFPDILMINGHGIAHPLFCGCASHIGFLTSIPTIGIAQKFLHGMTSEIPVSVGSYCYATYSGRRVAAVFLSKKGCKPIIISAGHFITLGGCLKIVKQSLKGYKFPEPLRLAHKFAQDEQRRM